MSSSWMPSTGVLPLSHRGRRALNAGSNVSSTPYAPRTHPPRHTVGWHAVADGVFTRSTATCCRYWLRADHFPAALHSVSSLVDRTSPVRFSAGTLASWIPISQPPHRWIPSPQPAVHTLSDLSTGSHGSIGGYPPQGRMRSGPSAPLPCGEPHSSGENPNRSSNATPKTRTCATLRRGGPAVSASGNTPCTQRYISSSSALSAPCCCSLSRRALFAARDCLPALRKTRPDGYQVTALY